VLPVGIVFAFIGRQLGRILSLAFNWATIVLFGRVPNDRELYLSGMALTATLWPIVLAGIAFPSLATFLLGFFTVPDWLHPWVRLAMLVLAIALPLAVGLLSSRIPDADRRPRGRALAATILRGFPNSVALFFGIVWMMFVAPIGRVRAFAKRWDSVHVPIAVKPGGYEDVVADLDGAHARAHEALAARTPRVRDDASPDGSRDARQEPDARARACGDRTRAHVHGGLSDLDESGAGLRGPARPRGPRRGRSRTDRRGSGEGRSRLRGMGDPLPAPAPGAAAAQPDGERQGRRPRRAASP